MKKVIAIVAVLMIFAFGVAAIHAQQTDTKDHGMMTGAGCPVMAKNLSPAGLACGGGSECRHLNRELKSAGACERLEQ